MAWADSRELTVERAANIREGRLERRGPGVVGKWETYWFRLEQKFLTCFILEADGRHGFTESCISLDLISKLTLEADKHECTFVPANGVGRIRLRASSEQETQAWYTALRVGHTWDQRYPQRSKSKGDPQLSKSKGDPQLSKSKWGAGTPPYATSPHATPPQPIHTREDAPVTSRIQDLHALHGLKQQRIEHRRLQREAEEQRRIEEEREAARWGTRAGLNPHDLSWMEASERLYGDDREKVHRRHELRRKVELQERQMVEEKRFRKPARQVVPDVDPASAGIRLYEDHKRREYEKQIQRAEEEAIERNAARSAPHFSNHYEKLYDDAQHRKQQQARKQREHEECEARKLAESAVSQRTGPVDMNCIERLYSEHQNRIKKQYFQLSQREAREEQDAALARSKRPVAGGSRQGKESKEPIWQRSGVMPYFKGGPPEREAKKPVKERATQTTVVLSAVLQAVTLRCGDGNPVYVADAKELLHPLRQVLSQYNEAQVSCERSEGYPALCVRAHQRLFGDGYLLPEFEGFEHCRAPNPIRQVRDCFGELMFHASRAQVALQEMFLPPPSGSRWPPGTTRTGLACIRQALFAYNPGLKLREAAEIKAKVKFQPAEGCRCYWHLLDLARLALVFPSCDLLHAGLDEVISTFEVVQVRNFFMTPTHLGERFIEVLVVIKLEDDEGTQCPLVCEIRLEDINFYRAKQLVARPLEEFYKRLHVLLNRSSRDMDALTYVAKAKLNGPSDSHALRVFRRHLAQTYGSIVTAWRRLGCGRLVSFERFREICKVLKCREYAPVYWCLLDPGSGGCISLYELAPEAVSLLTRAKLRIRGMDSREDEDDETFFGKLAPRNENGQIEAPEILRLFRSLGFSSTDARRIFRHLDFKGLQEFKPPASLVFSDVGWLRRLSSVVDLDAVILGAKGGQSEYEALQMCTKNALVTRRFRKGAVTPLQRNSKFTLPQQGQRRRASSANCRKSSQLAVNVAPGGDADDLAASHDSEEGCPTAPRKESSSSSARRSRSAGSLQQSIEGSRASKQGSYLMPSTLGRQSMSKKCDPGSHLMPSTLGRQSMSEDGEPGARSPHQRHAASVQLHEAVQQQQQQQQEEEEEERDGEPEGEAVDNPIAGGRRERKVGKKRRTTGRLQSDWLQPNVLNDY